MAGAQAGANGIHTTAFWRAASPNHWALTFGIRCWVSKSTQIRPNHQAAALRRRRPRTGIKLYTAMTR